MLTDSPPRARAARALFERSDALHDLPLPDDDRLRVPARAIRAALAADDRPGLERACLEFACVAAAFYGVRAPGVKVLASRPLRRYKGGGRAELFGDYDLETSLIRVWMRTAIQHKVTSFGTFFSTLCHEFCHHLDLHLLGIPQTPHTRGFYERTAALYHHASETERKRLAWLATTRGTWQVDWSKMPRTRAPRASN